MLKEKSVYKEELPVNVTVADIKNYPIHFHEDIEVIFVLDGSVKLKSGYYTYILKQGDIFIVNNKDIHSIEGLGEPNMTMMLQINLKYFSNYYEGLKDSFFLVDMDKAKKESTEVLKTILAKIMMEIIQKGFGYEQKVIESAHNLVACLFADFRYRIAEDGRFIGESEDRGDKILAGRLNRITDYMYENYARKLTLSEIAEKERLSIYYLSHVIKEATGLSFQELLSFIRAEESEKLLLTTNKKIGVIAEETGFSAVRYYIKHFQTWYGMHPSEYRKQYTGKPVGRESRAEYERSTPDEIERAIKAEVKSVYGAYMSKKKPEPVMVNIDLFKSFEEETPLEFDDSIFLNENMKPIARPYNLLINLKENIIKSSNEYIVTTTTKYSEKFHSMSILLYNIPEVFSASPKGNPSKEKILEIIKEYDVEKEFLIRTSGLTGEFKISRHLISRENLISAYEDLIRQQTATGKRQAIINNWSTLPHIEFSKATVSETLSIISHLRGTGAELILIDRI